MSANVESSVERVQKAGGSVYYSASGKQISKGEFESSYSKGSGKRYVRRSVEGSKEVRVAVASSPATSAQTTQMTVMQRPSSIPPSARITPQSPSYKSEREARIRNLMEQQRTSALLRGAPLTERRRVELEERSDLLAAERYGFGKYFPGGSYTPSFGAPGVLPSANLGLVASVPNTKQTEMALLSPAPVRVKEDWRSSQLRYWRSIRLGNVRDVVSGGAYGVRLAGSLVAMPTEFAGFTVQEVGKANVSFSERFAKVPGARLIGGAGRLTEGVGRFIFETGRSQREHPYKTAAYFAAFSALPSVLQGGHTVAAKLGLVTKVAKVTGLIPKPLREGISQSIGLELTGIYGLSSYYKVKASDDKIKAAANILGTEVMPMVAGTYVGYQLAPRIAGYLSSIGRKEVPLEQISPPEAVTYQQAPTKKHLELFYKGEYDLPDEELYGAYHTTGQRFTYKSGGVYSKEIVFEKGTSELPGLYVSPQVSRPFLRVHPGEYKAVSFDIFQLPGKPGIKRIYPFTQEEPFVELPKGVFGNLPAARKYLDVLGASDVAASVRGKVFVPGVKTEIEGIIPYGTKAVVVGEEFFTKVEGVRVPITRLQIVGKKISSKGFAFFESAFSEVPKVGYLSSGSSYGAASILGKVLPSYSAPKSYPTRFYKGSSPRLSRVVSSAVSIPSIPSIPSISIPSIPSVPSVPSPPSITKIIYRTSTGGGYTPSPVSPVFIPSYTPPPGKSIKPLTFAGLGISKTKGFSNLLRKGKYQYSLVAKVKNIRAKRMRKYLSGLEIREIIGM